MGRTTEESHGLDSERDWILRFAQNDKKNSE